MNPLMFVKTASWALLTVATLLCFVLICAILAVAPIAIASLHKGTESVQENEIEHLKMVDGKDAYIASLCESGQLKGGLCNGP